MAHSTKAHDLEPHSLSARGPERDALAILTAFVVVTLAIPSKYTIASLGGAGSLSTMFGALSLGAWAFMHISRREPRPVVAQPARRALVLFLMALLASAVVAARRPGGTEELWFTQFALVLLLSWAGVTLLASDFLVRWATIRALVNRLALAAGFYAMLGIIQYFSGETLINNLPLPGLSLNQTLISITDRGGLNRPASTAVHAIEFGVVMTALLPICLHVLLHSTELGRLRRGFPVVAILFTIPLSISRSAIICAAISLLVYIPFWPSHLRVKAFVGLLAGGCLTFVTAPGVSGTLLGLFTGAANDPSALSRTGSYALAADFIGQNPLFGRGFGTFLPMYRILDNQYLGLLIEIGILGLLAFLAVFITTMLCMVVARRTTEDRRIKDLTSALLAATASTGTGYAFFDGFGFQQYACVTFLVLGLAGAVCRLVRVRAMSRSGAL